MITAESPGWRGDEAHNCWEVTAPQRSPPRLARPRGRSTDHPRAL